MHRSARTGHDPWEGRRWADIPLRERLRAPRRRRYLTYLLLAARTRMLLPGDQAISYTRNVLGEVVRVDSNGVTIADPRCGRVLVPWSEVWPM